MECLLISGGVGDKGGEKERKLKFTECLECVTSSLFNPQKPFFITMIQMRLVKFSGLLEVTQIVSDQTGKSIWFFVS